jgi:hypothetical protein
MPWQALRMLDAVLCAVNNGENHEQKKGKKGRTIVFCMLKI